MVDVPHTMLEMQSWSIEKAHDRVLGLGHNDLAQRMRSASLGLGWRSTGRDIALINGLMAQAFLVIAEGKRPGETRIPIGPGPKSAA